MRWFTARRRLKSIANSGVCTLPRVLDLPCYKKILVFAPHPDDEVFGCGGTLAMLAETGCDVRVVVVTDGGKGDPDDLFGGAVAHLRKAESTAALKHLGVLDVIFFDEPDGDFKVSSETMEKFSKIYKSFLPDWIFVPSVSDYHRDHAAVSLAFFDVWAKNGFSGRLFFYEVWGGMPVSWLVDITDAIEKKRAAIREYKVPLKYIGYEIAKMGLAAYRGMFLGSATEQKYAESFLEVPQDNSAFPLLDLLLKGREYVDRISR